MDDQEALPRVQAMRRMVFRHESAAFLRAIQEFLAELAKLPAQNPAWVNQQLRRVLDSLSQKDYLYAIEILEYELWPAYRGRGGET